MLSTNIYNVNADRKGSIIRTEMVKIAQVLEAAKYYFQTVASID